MLARPLRSDSFMLLNIQSAQRARWAVAAMFMVNGFLMGSWAPQIPFMLPRHHITEFTLGLLIFLVGVGAVTAMSWTGWLINHYGSRKVVIGFALIVCASFALIVLAPTIPLSIPALILFGASLGSMDVAMNANAVEVEARLNKAIMSSSHGFWSLGGFIGGGIGGFLIARFGVEGHALIASGLALATALAAVPFMVTEAHHHEEHAEKPKYVWPKSAAVYVLGFMALFSMIPEGAVLDWAALYMGKELGANVQVSGFAFAFFAGTMAIMRFLGDGVRNRFGAVGTLRYSGFIAAVGMLAGGIAPNPWLAIAAFAVSGVGVANMVPIIFSAAGNQPGLSPGAGISLVTLMGYSGILVAPSSIGFVAEHIGFRTTYVTLAFFLVVVALLAGRVASADRAAAAKGLTPPQQATP
jgi:fucose permease